jgi:hypothetical protein
MRSKYFFYLVATMLGLNLAYAGSMLLPPGAKKVDEQTVTLGGQTAHADFYETNASSDSVAAYYRQNLPPQNFSLSKDTTEQQKNYLLFQSENQSVSIIVEPTDSGSKFSVSSYMKTGEMQNPQWQEFVNLMPKEDVPGADLDVVPRPPDSVRIGCQPLENMAFLGYTTDASADFLKKFYLDNMATYGWTNKPTTDFKTQLAEARAKKPNTMTNLDSMAVTSDMSVMRLAEHTTILNFDGPKGNVSVSIMPLKPDDPNSKMLVSIRYAEKKEIYETTK